MATIRTMYPNNPADIPLRVPLGKDFAAVADATHPVEANQLLQVMLTYEAAIADRPPPPQTGADADALLHAVDATLSALRLPAPQC